MMPSKKPIKIKTNDPICKVNKLNESNYSPTKWTTLNVKDKRLPIFKTFTEMIMIGILQASNIAQNVKAIYIVNILPQRAIISSLITCLHKFSKSAPEKLPVLLAISSKLRPPAGLFLV